MTTSRVQCPFCGSYEVSTSIEPHRIPIPHGPDAVYDAIVNRCATCSEHGDFEMMNDGVIRVALEEAQQKSVGMMLGWFAEHGVSRPYFERALDLPPRTLDGWANGEISAEGLALLRVVRTLPSILDLADARFDLTSFMK